MRKDTLYHCTIVPFGFVNVTVRRLKLLILYLYNIYVPRNDDPNHPISFPTIDDTIVAKAIRYIQDDNGKNKLEIEIIDSLYYHKLKEPCIKINGVCELDEDRNITITKVTRLTLADRQPEPIEERW